MVQDPEITGSGKAPEARGSAGAVPLADQGSVLAVAETDRNATVPTAGGGGPPQVQEVREKRKLGRLLRVLLWVAVAAGAFHLGYAAEPGVCLMIYLFALLQLARTATGRASYYSGLAVGLLIAAGRLTFFWTIFSAGAAALWYVYAFWLGLFVAISGACLRRLQAKAWCLIPFLWTGLEYFRSELYYLRFSWLNGGYAFADAPWRAPLHWLGMYGTGFLLMTAACAAAWLWSKRPVLALAMLGVGAALVSFGGFGQPPQPPPPSKVVRITGVQLEAPVEQAVLLRLEQANREYPDTDLFVLSEYTFMDTIPAKVKGWCRKRHCYLVVGGEEPAPGGKYYNTSFVIGPEGEVVFQQAKSVPIQFFKDGLPAKEQRLWASPWGKIGICICYDLSYRRVTDPLVKLGAEALVVPTMDVQDWGRRQHELHARVAPIRAAEYGIPIFRLASSGISQCVTREGAVSASAPCPGEGAILRGTLALRGPGRLPWDSWLAPVCAGVAACVLLWLAAPLIGRKFQRRATAPPLS